MGRLVLYIGALLTAGALATARGQPVAAPVPPDYPISPPASNSPLQQQILRNYRTDLQQTERELSARNPSGLSREQVDVMHQLNAVNSALTPPAPLPPPVPSPPASPVGTPLGALQPMPVR